MCSGETLGEDCEIYKCSVGLYCAVSGGFDAAGKCAEQVGEGAGCTTNENCMNNYFCAANKKCVKYASIKNNEKCEKDDNCESFFCNPSDKTCYDPPKSSGTAPILCTDSVAACQSETWELMDGNKGSVTATCACGYNSRRDKYCSLNPGDPEYVAHSAIMKSWLTGDSINKCNSYHRTGTTCLETYMDSDTLEQKVYY